MKPTETKNARKNWLLRGLVISNLAIILIGETFSSAFTKYEIIDLLVLFLIVLAIYRIATRISLTDPLLRTFVMGCLIALLLFALSKIFGLIGFIEYHETNASNFVMGGIVSIIIGTEAFLRIYEKRSYLTMRFLQFMALGFSAVAMTAMIDYHLVDFYLGAIRDYLYTSFMLIVVVIGLLRLHKIRKAVPVVRGLATATMIVIILTVIATLPEILYVSTTGFVNVHHVQVTLISHFILYAALSVLFYAFEQLRNPGGVYNKLSNN